MSSRDGHSFKRWGESFLRPGPQHPNNWAHGDHYMAWHAVETASAIPGAPKEISLYATESYWTGKSDRLRRYTLRVDGFVSVTAPMQGGELLTRPLIFAGDTLEIKLFEFCCREHPDRSSGFRGARNGRLYPGRFLRNLWGSAKPTGGMEEWSPTGLSGGKASKTALRNEGRRSVLPTASVTFIPKPFTAHCALRRLQRTWGRPGRSERRCRPGVDVGPRRS